MWTKKALSENYMDDDSNELVFSLPCNKWATSVFKLAFGFWIHPNVDADFMEEVLLRAQIRAEDDE